jgi:hypothetical protein
MNNQAVTAHWKLVADEPVHNGPYLTCFRMENNTLGNQEIVLFQDGDWLEMTSGHFETVFPDYWTSVPNPRD